MYTNEKIFETAGRTCATKGVKYCIGAYVDIHGVPKAKVVPLAHLAHMAPWFGALYRLRARRPRPGAERRRDHLGARSRSRHPVAVGAEGRLDAGRQYVPGQALSAQHARRARRTCLARAAELGFGFNLGIECEIYVLRQNADGTLSVPNPDDKLAKPCYDVRGFLDNFTWLDKVATCINDLGWDLLFVRPRGRATANTSSTSTMPTRSPCATG